MNEFWNSRRVLRGAAAAGLAGALALGVGGCKSKTQANPVASTDGQDPADANLAPPYTGGNAGGYSPDGQGPGAKVLGASQAYTPQASSETYGYDQQAPAPIIRSQPEGAPGTQPQNNVQNAADQGYTDAEEAGEQAIADTDQAPPPLPEYDQPPAPEPDYLWTPGYWNYAQTGYYWVPGAWVAPPFYGALWTPPWWGSFGGHWLFHRGYWGPHVGYYGGIDYGFGYIGTGYFGGYWRGHDFVYNRAVTNVNPSMVHNFYSRPVVYDGVHYGPHPTDRVSYNGGRGGINTRPSASELAALHEPHYAPVAAQREVRMAAASNHSQFYKTNDGHPAQAFASHPVGSRSNIAATPHEQPFNHVTPANAGSRAAEAQDPGFETRPGAAAAEHGFAAVHGSSPEPGRNGAETGRAADATAHRGAEARGPETHTAERQGFGSNARGTETGRAGVPNAHPGTEAGRGNDLNARHNAEAGRLNAPAERQGFGAGRANMPGTRPGLEASHAGQPAAQSFHNSPETRPRAEANPRSGFAGQRSEPGASQRPEAGAGRSAFGTEHTPAPIERPAYNNNRPANNSPERSFTPPATPASPHSGMPTMMRPETFPRAQQVPRAEPSPGSRSAPAPRTEPSPGFRSAPAPRGASAPAFRPAPAPHAAPAQHGGGDHEHGHH